MINIVAVEGLDGCGKTVFSKGLCEVFERIVPSTTHVEYVHFPFYESESGKEIKDFLFNGDTSKPGAIKNIIMLYAKNRHDWYADNYRRLKDNYQDTLIIADRYRHSNDYLNAARFRDIEKVIDVSNDYELNGLGVKKECCNIVLTTPKELQLKRLSEKKLIDQYETEKNVKFIRSRMKRVTRHIYDKSFIIFPAEYLDKEYCKRNMHLDIKDIDMKTMLIAATMIAKILNKTVLRGTNSTIPTNRCQIDHNLKNIINASINELVADIFANKKEGN